MTLSSDNVFGDGWDAELATVSGAPASGMAISIIVGVAEKSQNTASAPPAGGGADPGGPGSGR